MLERCEAKGTLPHCWWEYKLVQLLWRTVQRSLKKLKIELLYDPAVLLLAIYPEKNMILKDACALVFTAALLTVDKTWKQPKCPSTAAAAKSLQSCPTLCDPIDGSPPASAVPGILQARTLEWVAISFSNA